MSEIKHTPGPWFDWDQMAWLYPSHRLLSNTEDARLIAAAPELLEALEGYMAAFGQGYAANSLPYGEQQKCADKKARAAIAKAKGTA